MMKAIEITEQHILFDTGSEIKLSASGWTMELDEAEQEKLKASEFNHAAFQERPYGFAFGNLIRTMVEVKLHTDGSERSTWVISDGCRILNTANHA